MEQEHYPAPFFMRIALYTHTVREKYYAYWLHAHRA